MGNKFLALRKSEVAKVAPNRAGKPGFRQIGEQGEEVLPWNVDILHSA